MSHRKLEYYAALKANISAKTGIKSTASKRHAA